MHGGPADGLHAASARKPPARVVQVSRSAGKIGLSVAIDTLSTAGLARNVNSRYNRCLSISQHATASGNAISTVRRHGCGACAAAARCVGRCERSSGAVAQLVRVPDCRSGGCGFESRRPRLSHLTTTDDKSHQTPCSARGFVFDGRLLCPSAPRQTRSPYDMKRHQQV